MQLTPKILGHACPSFVPSDQILYTALEFGNI